MAIGIGAGIVIEGYNIPEIQLSNFHPEGTPIFPFLFITIACGAISGFHATQSPIMARCVKKRIRGKKSILWCNDCRGSYSLGLGSGSYVILW